MKFLINLIFIALLSSSGLFGQSYQNIESVEYDPGQNRFFVSNGNSIIQRNADGSLEYFGSGAASYGMEVMNGHLFVIQNGIKAFNLETAEEVMSLSISGSGFLNGLAADGNGRLYATDFSNNRIYNIDVNDLSNPSYTILISDTGSTPNGITYDADNNRLVFVSWGNNAAIKEVNLFTQTVNTVYNTSLGNIDGIDIDNQGNFYIASWSPNRISKFDNSFSNAPETITAPGLNNPADICYANAIDTLAIPNSGNNTVSFVGFSIVSDVNEPIEDFSFDIFPNPSTENATIKYVLAQQEKVSINLYDMNGKLIKSLINETQYEGKHQVLFNGLHIPSGQYIIKFEAESFIESKSIFIK